MNVKSIATIIVAFASAMLSVHAIADDAGGDVSNSCVDIVQTDLIATNESITATMWLADSFCVKAQYQFNADINDDGLPDYSSMMRVRAESDYSFHGSPDWMVYVDEANNSITFDFPTPELLDEYGDRVSQVTVWFRAHLKQDTDLYPDAPGLLVDLPDCEAALPEPTAEYVGADYESVLSLTRHTVRVSNWEDYIELFQPAPYLPPCGLNTNATRTWLTTETSTGSSFRFCGLAPANLDTGVWFVVFDGEPLPTDFRIRFHDRFCDREYNSEWVPVPQAANLSVASFSAPSMASLDEPIGSSIDLVVANTGGIIVPAGTVPIPIGIYISVDPVITTSDRLLQGGREFLLSDLAPGETVVVPVWFGANISSTFPDATPPTGNLYIGVLVDEINSLPESDENDNYASQPILVE